MGGNKTKKRAFLFYGNAESRNNGSIGTFTEGSFLCLHDKSVQAIASEDPRLLFSNMDVTIVVPKPLLDFTNKYMCNGCHNCLLDNNSENHTVVKNH